MSLVSWSLVQTAIYARKKKAYDNGDSISRRRWGRAARPVCAGSSSSWLCRAMLSESSCCMATYCCDLIFCVSLALIGGRADERTTAPSPGVLGMGSSAARAGEVKLAEVAIVVEVDAIAPLVVGAGKQPVARHPRVSMQHL